MRHSRQRPATVGALAAVAFVSSLTLLTFTSDAGDRRFTVADSISMTRVIDPDVNNMYSNAPLRFQASPDGQKVAVVTMRGDLTTGLNEYQLVLCSVAEALAAAAPSVSMNFCQDVLVQFATDAPEQDGIESVEWTADGKALLFIGRGADRMGQVYRADISSRSVHRLTEHANDIVTFGVSRDSDTVVFGARTPPDWTRRNRHGYAVKSESSYLLNTTDPAREASSNIRYFVQDLRTRSVRAVDMEAGYLRPGEISIDPFSRWAVIASTVRNLPAHWASYAFLRDNPARVRADPSTRRSASDGSHIRFDDAFGSPDPTVMQYRLVDLRTGAARELLDAPTLADTNIEAQWSGDGHFVVLPSTYLPVRDGQDAHVVQEPGTRMIVVVDVTTDTYSYSVLAATGDRQLPDGTPMSLRGVRWVSAAEIELQYMSRSSTHPQSFVERYRARSRQWRHAGSQMQAVARGQRIDKSGAVLSIQQDLNTPPELMLVSATGIEQIISDFNPQLRSKNLGEVRLFSWEDRLGRQFTGGLVLPPDYQSSRQYPVVIQANGFTPELFLVDGPDKHSSAHAARAIAARGIMVLQMPRFFQAALSGSRREPRQTEAPSETAQFVAQLEGAIDALADRRLIDRTRVGLIGFSREGMYVHYAVTFSRYPILAATIADSVALTPACYAQLYGAPFPGMSEFDTDATAWFKYETRLAISAPFWGDGIAQWLDRSYIYHLDRIRSAIRYETYGTKQMPCHWESFAILKRHHRAVEMIHIPDAAHVPTSPYARRTSQEGNVDWYDFWLNGHEDPAQDKVEQYVRWRELRHNREQQLSELAGHEAIGPSSGE